MTGPDPQVRQGVDTRVVLALHALGVRSFAAGRTPALPSPATGFSFEDLRFFPAEDAEDGHRAEAFALLLNSRFRPPVATPEARLLWDVYGDVLDPALVDLADPVPTPEEQARYDAAHALLTPQVMATWAACKQALGLALLALAAAQAGRPLPGSPDEATWQARVSAAQDAVAAAEADLSVTGRSGEVEAALAVVRAWSTAETTVSWSDHRDALSAATSSSPDGVSSFCLTRFAPTDVLDGRGWVPFSLAGSALAELVGNLPAQVSALGGDGAADAGLASLSVELTAVEVLRGWCDPGVLRSTAWRFSDATHPALSDGGDPATGDFPYLVTGLVLARNLVLQPAASGGAAPPPVRLGYLSRGIEMAPRTVVRVPSAGPSLKGRFGLRVGLADGADVGEPVGEPGGPGPRFASPAALLAMRRDDSDPPDWPHRRRLPEVDWPSPVVVTPGPPAATPPPSAQTVVGDQEAIVVAYLLEPVGRAPSPDPVLPWPGSAPAAGPVPAQRVHVVTAGETLSSIARDAYGDPARYTDIAAANHIQDPNRIDVGQSLVLP